MKEMFSRITEIFTKPSTFFKNLREEGIGNSFLYALIFSLFSVIMSFWIGNSDFMNLFNLYGLTLTPLNISFFVIFLWAISLVSLFVIAGIVHMFIKMLGGKADYSKTYQIMTYSSVPSWLLSWIPYAGALIGAVFGIYLTLKGTSQLHSISMGRAIGAYALLMLAIMIIAIIIGVVFATMFLL